MNEDVFPIEQMEDFPMSFVSFREGVVISKKNKCRNTPQATARGRYGRWFRGAEGGSRLSSCRWARMLHPGRLTWNLQISHLERKTIFQTSMIMFHVNLQGCIHLFHCSHFDWFCPCLLLTFKILR